LADLRRSAELSPNEHGHIAIQAARVYVFHQRGNALIEERQARTKTLEILVVRIPETIGHGHAARSRFHQTPGDEELVVPLRSAVPLRPRRASAIAIAYLDRLLLDIHGFDQLAGSQYIESALLIDVQVGAVRFSADAFQLFQEVPPLA